MSWFMVDVECDGPCPGLYSMVQVGLVKVEKDPKETFYGEFKPLSGASWKEDALKIIHVSRETTLTYPEAIATMVKLDEWLQIHNKGRAQIISDNNGWDVAFLSYYFHAFIGYNPFGHTSTNLGSLYKGLEKNMFKSFHHLRITPHDHNPVNDALGNVEALIFMKENLGLKINLD